MFDAVINFLRGIIIFLQTYNGAVTAIATVAIGFFTLSLVCVTNRQARLTRESIELGNKEFIATHRPRLVVRFTTPEAIRPGKPRVQIIVENSGDTNAYVAHFAADIAQRVSAIWIGMPHFPSGSPVTPERVIAPGGRDWFRAEANWPLSADNIAAVENGTTKLILVGHLQYRDDNDVIRYTGFYRQYDPIEREYRRLDPTHEREYAS